MANSILISTAILLTATLLSSSYATAHDLDLYFPATTPASCSGGSSIEECMLSGGEEEEDDFDGEALPEELGGDDASIRRVLYWRRRRYISYGALLRDRVPCSRRGYSYYNCRPGARANPYTRGCSAIARCRSF